MTFHSELLMGVNMQKLSPGSVVHVETLSRHYRIEYLGGDTMRICGHPDYCPAPATALLRGSMDDQGSVATGLIEPGTRLLYFLNDLGPVATSRVVSVQVAGSEALQ